jgi:hypothetical protein
MRQYVGQILKPIDAGAMGGRLRRSPSLLGRAKPARTRAWIMARSKTTASAETVFKVEGYNKCVL